MKIFYIKLYENCSTYKAYFIVLFLISITDSYCSESYDKNELFTRKHNIEQRFTVRHLLVKIEPQQSNQELSITPNNIQDLLDKNKLDAAFKTIRAAESLFETLLVAEVLISNARLSNQTKYNLRFYVAKKIYLMRVIAQWFADPKLTVVDFTETNREIKDYLTKHLFGRV